MEEYEWPKKEYDSGVFTNDVRCPYTKDENWDGKCPYGKTECAKPYLDTVIGFMSSNWCRQKGMPLWVIDLLIKDGDPFGFLDYQSPPEL